MIFRFGGAFDMPLRSRYFSEQSHFLDDALDALEAASFHVSTLRKIGPIFSDFAGRRWRLVLPPDSFHAPAMPTL